MVKVILSVVCVLFFHAGSVNADSYFGYGVSANNYKVEDPIGGTESKTDSALVHFIYYSTLNRNTRWSVEVTNDDFSLDASTTNIGQEVDYISVNVGYGKRFALTRLFKPWVDVIGGIQNIDATGRHNVDAGGFLNQTFPNRSETVFNVGLSATEGFKLADKVDLNLRLMYLTPLGDGIEDLSFATFITYKF